MWEKTGSVLHFSISTHATTSVFPITVWTISQQTILNILWLL